MATAISAAEAPVGEVLRSHHEEPGLRIEIAGFAMRHRLFVPVADVRIQRMRRIEPIRVRLTQRAWGEWIGHVHDGNPISPRRHPRHRQPIVEGCLGDIACSLS